MSSRYSPRELLVLDVNDAPPARPTPSSSPVCARKLDQERRRADRAEAEVATLRRRQSVLARCLGEPWLRTEGLTIYRTVLAAERAWASIPEHERPDDAMVRVPLP